ncbi:extracellular solute-binding protein [Bacillus sp. FJAT-26390]|uniref:extracellular solute-binding protein n=1 Tax=Bacillus sp. FJAT-26390 TaxID=1743142 RepID=UPI000AE7263E|nr:extracellular solute-binding protein [Bacillus sp. FJAT-26390]
MVSNLRLSYITRKIVPVVLAFLIVLPFGSGVQADTSSSSSSTNEQLGSGTDKTASNNERKYAQYMKEYEGAARPEKEIVLEAAGYSRLDGAGFEKIDQYEGMDGVSLLTGEAGEADWTFQVEEAGLYNLSLLYYPIEGKSSAIERALWIDGERPFREAAFLQFDRIWDNQKEKIVQDNQGNDLRPKQIEKPRWSEKAFQDSDGYENEPFLFYFSRGTHTITLESTREPMVIKQLKLFQQTAPLPYEQMLQQYDADGLKETEGQMITIEGEASRAKSSPTLYPLSERSSAAVYPYSASKIKINTIGGFNWRLPGQWMEWEIDVPETGLYKIAFKSQQNFVRGIYSTRTLTIDGEVPFKEMEKIPFRYKSGYRLDVMGGKDPYLFPLEQGKHTLRLEVSLGEFAPLIREVEESLYSLNEMYRKILMITGTKPDEFRDYQLDKKVPDLLSVFGSERDRLKAIASQLVKLSGQSSDQEALLKTMAVQLDEMIKDPDTVPRRLTAYKTNTGGLGTWVQQARQQPLEIDTIYVASPDKKFPKKGMGLGSKLKHEATTFVSSFFTDYNQIGNVAEDDAQRSITVWIGSGRDQANTMKAMIDETFTSVTGINVNLKLVNMGTLLPATLAGQGPDVAMQIDNDIPVNFAMRNASADLTQFADFTEVKDRFRPSAIVPYSYEKGVFALPETQTFNMLFYRKDVLSELGLEVPQTWDDVSNLLAVLSKNHMQFGLPVVAQAAVQGQNIPPNSMYAALLFQNGGAFYRDGGKESDLDSRVGIETFKQWTEFYTDYKLEREYDFANRFRTGQMPIGIADYTTYNQLSVFAPEIRGMWGFAPIPGTAQKDGAVNREVPSGGSAVIMLNKAEDKDAAWQFMKWWTSDATQTVFGREMEGLMGAAARYPTANIKALDSLPWPVADYENLKAQFEWVQGMPEVPGGYFTGRHLFNAFYKTVVGQVEARESIMDYVQYMQDEIRTKRKEFGLPQ